MVLVYAESCIQPDSVGSAAQPRLDLAEEEEPVEWSRQVEEFHGSDLSPLVLLFTCDSPGSG